MGHRLVAVVGPPSALAAYAAARALPSPVPLAHGLALVPLPDDALDAFLPPSSLAAPGFRQLSHALVDDLRAASSGTRLAYVETDCHGGAGGQGAAVFVDGAATLGPAWAPLGVVHAALVGLGVRPGPHEADAFEAVGLGRHRTTEDWLADGSVDASGG